MELDDPCMQEMSAQARTYFLACYAVSLVDGDTILGGSIRSRTLRHYITDAKTLFTARNLVTIGIKDTDYVDIIVNTVQKYEKVANRRNMITDSMVSWFIDKTK